MDWMNDDLILRLDEATRSKGSIIDGKDGECYVDIRGSQVVVPTFVDWGPFIVDPWTSISLCTDCMPELWGPVNRRSSMIIVVGKYSTIPLEISIGIVYGPPTDRLVCGIVWKTCTRDRWDLDWPYDVVTEGCHTWPIHGRAYIVLVRFIPLQDWLLIRISTTLSDMSDSLFTTPTRSTACLLLWWWLRWLINDDEHDYIMMMYLLYSIDCYLAYSRSGRSPLFLYNLYD
jgi:hypothetical protein